MEEKSRSDLEITEVGEIFFLYRPKVDVEQPHSADEVQRLYMVFRPVSADKNVEVKQDPDSEDVKEKKAQSNEEKPEGKKEAEEIKETVKVKSPGKGESKKSKDEKSVGEIREEVKRESKGEQGMQEVDLTKEMLMRLIIIGKKILPDPSFKGRPVWCYVDLVTTSPQAMKEGLAAHEYDTKTRGHRVQPSARPAAEGVYCILKHKNHAHLVYKLDKPREEDGGLQEEFNIENEASFIISVKNPDTSAPPNAGLRNKRKAMYPAKLQALMGSYRFVPAHPTDFLNYEGCEFILVPASDDIGRELGLELEPEEYDAKLCADLAKMVDMSSEVSRKPLFHGQWA